MTADDLETLINLLNRSLGRRVILSTDERIAIRTAITDAEEELRKNGALVRADLEAL